MVLKTDFDTARETVLSGVLIIYYDFVSGRSDKERLCVIQGSKNGKKGRSRSQNMFLKNSKQKYADGVYFGFSSSWMLPCWTYSYISNLCRSGKTELCRFSGAKIYPGRGIRFVRADSQVFLFANSKCKRYFHNRLKPSKLTWTAMYRKQHKKFARFERGHLIQSSPFTYELSLGFQQTTAAAMVLKTELCRFSGAKIYPGRGIRFVRADSQFPTKYPYDILQEEEEEIASKTGKSSPYNCKGVLLFFLFSSVIAQ
ncbi:unnamed protein product [Ilex paraguariensis]|uniref:TRASH domain-containing protein n=1 Tax=Ilex paraguariensis TaxID=185542 RepID=A0ABC8T828_9AQUA